MRHHQTPATVIATIATATLLAVFASGSAAAPERSMVASCVVRAVAAGDFSTPQANINATGARAVALNPDYFFGLGDYAYPDGTPADYARTYAPSPWGRNLLAISLPTPGNHDYHRPAADGYFRFFEPPGAWYTTPLGCGWRVVSLNSNKPIAVQTSFLVSVIQQWPADHLVLIWHAPRWSSGKHGSNARYAPWFNAARSGDLILNGHEHSYERGDTDGQNWWVVGTGGKSNYPFGSVAPGSQKRITGKPGVLLLHLTDVGWAADFWTSGGAMIDSASG